MKNSQETKQSSSIKLGDVIRLGDHVLVCGDASQIDLATILQGKKISSGTPKEEKPSMDLSPKNLS